VVGEAVFGHDTQLCLIFKVGNPILRQNVQILKVARNETTK